MSSLSYGSVVHWTSTSRGLFTRLLDEAAAGDGLRSDIAASELADYCLHALSAAAKAPDDSAATRLVELTMRSLRADPEVS